MRGGGYDVKAVVKRIFRDAAGNKTSDMRHVCHEHCSHFVTYFGKLSVVKFSGVSRKTRQNYFWFVGDSQPTNLVIIKLACFDIFHAVPDKVVFAGTSRNGRTMSQVAAMS